MTIGCRRNLINLMLAGAALSAVAANGAEAADLGGNCCADLEERIAELEATTARKGNRKVSVTISGYIVQEITYWDDGGESNVYIHDMGPTQASHFKISGQATIAPGYTAGYMMRIQNLDANPFSRSDTGTVMNQNSDDNSLGLNVQMSYWYLQSKDYGKVSVGKSAQAAKSAVMFTDQSGTQILDNYTFLAGFPQFIIRSARRPRATGPDVGSTRLLLFPELAYRRRLQWHRHGGDPLRYTHLSRAFPPRPAGVKTTSGKWPAATAGELGGFKILAGIGYSKMTDESTTGAIVSEQKDLSYFQAGGYIQHLATGLFLHAAYGLEDNHNAPLINGRFTEDGEHWYVKAGIRQKCTPLGHTIVYGDYAEYYDQLGPGSTRPRRDGSSTLTPVRRRDCPGTRRRRDDGLSQIPAL